MARGDYIGQRLDAKEAIDLFRLAFGPDYIGYPLPAGGISTLLPNLTSPIKTIKSGANIIRSIVNNRGYAVRVFMPLEIGGLYMPNCVLSASNVKKIHKEEITNRNGTVKELISQGDWQFDVQGIEVGDGEWPEQFVADLRDLYERNEAVEIKGALTDILLQDERNVVIESLELPEMRGKQYSVAYRLKLISDINLELEVVDDNLLSLIQ